MPEGAERFRPHPSLPLYRNSRSALTYKARLCVNMGMRINFNIKLHTADLKIIYQFSLSFSNSAHLFRLFQNQVQ